MRINTFLLCILLSASTVSFSQFRLSVQPGVQVPLGEFSKTASVGISAHVTAEYINSPQKGTDWSITATTGYNYFSRNKKLPEGENYSYSDIPLLAGLRYYLGREDFRAYIGAELGFHLMTIKHNGESVGKSYFGFAPVIGFKSYLSRSLNIDVNVKLNSISSEGSSLSFIGFNFGVQFPLGK